MHIIDCMLRKLSVKHRIVSSFLLLVFFMTGILPLVYQNHNHFQKLLYRFSEVDTRADRLLLLASNQIMSSRVKFLRYYHDYLPSAMLAVTDIDQAKKLLIEAKQIIFLPQQKTAVTSVLEKVAQYAELVKGFKGQALQTTGPEYPRMVFQALQTGNDITLNIEKIVQDSEKNVALAIQEIQNEVVGHFKILAIAYFVILLLSLIISGLIARSITRPLSALRTGIEGLRKGIRAVDIPDHGEDEFSLLAQTLNQLTTDLEKTTTSVDALHKEIELRTVAEKDLQRSNSELKETQNQLVQSGKLASIGELAAGVAHELNQPLMVIRAGAQFTQRQAAKETLSGEHLMDHLEATERNTKRMMNIINHLRTFSRQSLMEHESVDINKMINDSFLMIGEQLKLRDIEVKRELSSTLPKCQGNTSQLEQVILNLLANARDALTQKAASNRRAEAHAKQIVISTAVCNDGEGVKISIQDNGDGIAPEICSNIFNPFFTTKDIGKGTGLGLSISYGIIQDHQGKIEVAETGPEGTTFQILLPCAQVMSAEKKQTLWPEDDDGKNKRAKAV